MPKRISKQKIVDCTLAGLNNSQKKYELWTGGDWLWTAPEYLLTTEIASSIASLNETKYITLENNVKTALDDAGAIGKGKLKNSLRQNGRFDILLWWADGTPRAVIEVKNQLHYFSQCRDDVSRIVSVLNQRQGEHSIQFGIFAFYTSAHNLESRTAMERIEDRLASVENSTKSFVKEEFKVKLFKSEPCFVDDSVWVSSCILID